MPALAQQAVTIDNPSFEADALDDGGATSPVTAWTGTGDVFGVFNPTDTQYVGANGNVLPGPGTDGANVAYVNGVSTLSQNLSITLAADTTYTMTGAIGHRLDIADGWHRFCRTRCWQHCDLNLEHSRSRNGKLCRLDAYLLLPGFAR